MFTKKVISPSNGEYKKRILDNVYLLIMSLYLIRQFFDTTLFHLSWPEWYLPGVRVSIVLYMVLKVLNKEYKNVWELVIVSGVMACMLMIYLSTGYGFFIDIGFLAIEARLIPYKRILKTYLAIGTIIMAITILGALTGCIEDLIYDEGKAHKHAFGIVYTTDFGAHIFFLLSAYLVIRERPPGVILNAILILISYLLYRISGTRCSSGSILLLVIGGIYVKHTNRVFANSIGESKWGKIKLRIIRLFDVCIALMAPFCALIMFLLTQYYSQTNALLDKINTVSTGRLGLGKWAIEKYGINLWGTAFNMIGAGGGDGDHPGYNFIDSSYILILVRYGLVLFIITLIGLVWLSYKARRFGKRMLLVTLSIVAIQCTIEHHLLEIAYNSFFLLIFSEIVQEERLMESIKINRQYRAIESCLAVIFVVALLIGYQCLLPFGRMLVMHYSLYDPNRNIYFIMAMIPFVTITALVAYMVKKWSFSMFESRNKKNR
ncbi:hypothetical protein [Lacrimispora sp.]|jgi:hypothetical protein|uniref:hypothetical protein n=1 Tax=Lacrimispora sp. TaxID=2719234 RepID=UPI0028AD071B|nr:hypothetical protein [Lacrimispora sp.]